MTTQSMDKVSLRRNPKKTKGIFFKNYYDHHDQEIKTKTWLRKLFCYDIVPGDAKSSRAVITPPHDLPASECHKDLAWDNYNYNTVTIIITTNN